MSLHRLVLLVGIAVPTTLTAQQRRPPQPRRFEQPRYSPDLKAKYLEELSPARIVSENQKDLALDGTQATQIQALRQAFASDAKRYAGVVKRFQKIISANPPSLKRPPEAKPTTKKDSVKRARDDSLNQVKHDGYVERVTAARSSLGETMLRIRAAYDSAAVKTLGVLRDDQRAKIGARIDEASDALTSLLRRANIR